MFKVAIGHSADIDLERMTDEAIAQARVGLEGAEPAAGLVALGGHLDATFVMARLKAAFPNAPLVGCTSAGEASGDLLYQDDSLVLVLFASDRARFAAAATTGQAADPDGVADRLAASLAKDLDGDAPRLIFLMVDMADSDPARITRRLSAAFDDDAAILGGVAGDFPPWGNPRTFYETRVEQDMVAALALSGDFDLSIATETSWRPIGKPGVVTKMTDRTIETIDDQPAIAFYQKRLGSTPESFVPIPLAIDRGDGAKLRLRAPVLADPERGALTVMGGLSQGDRVQIAMCNFDDAHDGAAKVIDEALAGFPSGKTPALAAFVSCAARKMFLASATADETAQIKSRLAPATRLFGMYAFGEIGPFATGEKPRLHNQTIVAMVLG